MYFVINVGRYPIAVSVSGKTLMSAMNKARKESEKMECKWHELKNSIYLEK